MKIRILLLLIIPAFIISCNSSAPEPDKAASFVENYITKTGNGDYTNIGDYYSEEMKNGETDEERINKLKPLKEGLGNVKKFEKIESKEDFYNNEKAITLVYAVKHDFMTVTETFTVVKEGSALKIAKQNVVSIK